MRRRDRPRHVPLLILQGGHARQLLPFEQFEAGAAAGGNERDLVGDAGFLDRLDAVAAADDRFRAVVFGDGFGDGKSPLAQSWISKTPIGPFQKMVWRRGNSCAVELDRLRSDIDPFPAVRDPLALRREFSGSDRLAREVEVLDNQVVHGQEELHTARLALSSAALAIPTAPARKANCRRSRRARV